MSFSKACFIAALVSVVPATHAQGAAPSSQELVEFAIGSAFQEAVIDALRVKCPSYKPSTPSSASFIAELRKSNRDLSNSLGPGLKATTLVAQAHAAQVVINAEGCDSADFKKSVEQIELHQTLMALRVMQGRFN